MRGPASQPPGGLDKRILAEFLLALARGGTLEEAALSAGLDPGRARILLSALASTGYVKALNPGSPSPGCPCERCPLRPICKGRLSRGAYVLTEKGRELLRSLLESLREEGGRQD